MFSEPTRVEIDRDRLHRAVWTAPIDKAAQALGVTTETLRRMVEILDVPLPGRGSWMSGHKSRAKPLPPREDGGPESVWLVHGRKRLVLEHDPQAAKHDEVPVVVPKGLHPIVARAARHYARPLLGLDGTMKPRSSTAPSMRVSVEQRERALGFADVLVRRLEKECCTVTWSGPLSVETPNGEVVLWLREETESVERPPTAAEAERERGRLVLGGPRKHFVERPTGRLVLAVRDPAGGGASGGGAARGVRAARPARARCRGRGRATAGAPACGAVDRVSPNEPRLMGASLSTLTSTRSRRDRTRGAVSVVVSWRFVRWDGRLWRSTEGVAS